MRGHGVPLRSPQPTGHRPALQGHGARPLCPCPHPPPGLPGKSPGWEPPPPPQATGLGGRGAHLRGLLLLGGLLRPSSAGVERLVHGVATSRAGRGGGGTRVIRAPRTERRVQGLVSVDREPPCRAPPRCLRLSHLRLPLRMRLLGGLGLGLLVVALARQVAMQPALEAGPRGPRLRGLRGLLLGRELAFLDPNSRPQGGTRAAGQRSCHLQLTVTLLRCLGSQENDERLHQWTLPRVVQLHVRNALQLAQE